MITYFIQCGNRYCDENIKQGMHVIVTIFREKAGTGRSLLAINLACQRAHAGHSVLLIDTTPDQSSRIWSNRRHAAGIKPAIPALAISGKGLQPELENIPSHYNDIVIDIAECDSLASKSALVAARLIVIPIQPHAPDLVYQKNLIERMNTARLFNPRLRVLVVPVCADSQPPLLDLDQARAFVAHLPAAQLANTIIRGLSVDQQVFDDGLSLCEDAKDKNAIAELSALYHEVFAG